MTNGPRLYVGNLLYAVQKDEVTAFFAENKITIKDIDMSTDPFTGRNPSYCFVNFHDQETADHAMQTLQNQAIRGRLVKINTKTDRRQAPARQLVEKTGNPAIDFNHQERFVFDRWKREDASDHWVKPTEEQRRVWFGGLPFIPNQDTVDSEMRALFAEWSIQAVSKLGFPKNESPGRVRFKCFCFVDFPDSEAAKVATEKLDQTESPHGGYYTVRIAESRPGKVHREQLDSVRDFKQQESKTQRPSPQRALGRDWRDRAPKNDPQDNKPSTSMALQSSNWETEQK